MNEKELSKYFVDFLISEKGYPRGSILLEAPLTDTWGTYRRYIADLVLLDTDHNNYLALIEFKHNATTLKVGALNRIRTHLQIIRKPSLPAYFVLPKSEDKNESDFVIYSIDNIDWRKIDKQDFPHFQTLKSKNQADEKQEFKDINETKIKDILKKKELLKSTAWSTLASLIVGITASIILSKDIFFSRGIIPNNSVITCCDTVAFGQEKINASIAIMEKSIFELKQHDSIMRGDGNKMEISNLKSRIIDLENLVNQTPERLLKIQELTFQIQSLKTLVEKERELGDIKLYNLKDRIDQLTIWTSGLMITIIGSIIGFAFNAFRKS